MNTSINVVRLAHVGLRVDNVDRSSEFYADRWGLDLAEEHEGHRYFRADSPDSHAVVLSEGAPDLDHIAFVVESADDLRRAEDALGMRGLPVEIPTTRDLEPGVGAALRFRDPAGVLVELVTDLEVRTDGYGTRDVKPLGLDHVVLRVPNYGASREFYENVLGFRLSDETENLMAFMRCNANHHSLALIRSEDPAPSMHHTAFTVEDWTALANGVKVLGDAGISRVWGPGRHGPGNNLFSYFFDPDQHIVEYTCEVMRVDDSTWVPRVWPRGRPEQWGTPMPATMR